MGIIARPRLSLDDLSFAPVEPFRAIEPEIESIGHFAHEFPSLFALVLLLFLTLGTILLAFVLPLFQQLLDLLLFFARILIRKRLVVFRDLRLVALEIHLVVRLYLGGLHTAFPSNLRASFHIHIVALFLVFFLVFLRDLADQNDNLIRR